MNIYTAHKSYARSNGLKVCSNLAIGEGVRGNLGAVNEGGFTPTFFRMYRTYMAEDKNLVYDGLQSEVVATDEIYGRA